MVQSWSSGPNPGVRIKGEVGSKVVMGKPWSPGRGEMIK